jgi:ABC-2 type transport system permease protein
VSGFAAVFVKELREYFATPVALALMAVFWAISGYFFSFSLFFGGAAQMVGAFHNMSILLLLVLPLLMMRAFAEENRIGTIELLLSLPLSEAQIVLGKFAAGLAVLIAMLAGTATAVLPLAIYSQPDLGPILGGYAGILLLGCAFMGVGMLVSSLTASQVIAALLTWGVLTLLWFADYAAALDAFPGLRRVFVHLSFSAHYVDVIRGVLNLGTVVYFSSVLVLALTATALVLRQRRA